MTTSHKQQNTYTGQVISVRYRSTENFAIFTLINGDGELVSEDIVCKGIIPSTTDIGDTVTVTGKWENSKYGRQLALISCIPEKPDTDSSEGVTRLLMKLPGIGRKKAEKAVKQHGHEQAWEFALKDPVKIDVRKGDVGQAKGIAVALTVNYDAMVYLIGIGITDHEAGKIIKHYGADAIQVVSEDPYRMIQDIDGFGFARVDGIALKGGIYPGAQSRIMAAVQFILTSSENDGHIWFPAKVLCAKAEDFLRRSAEKHRVSLLACPGYSEVKRAVLALKAEGKVVVEEQRIFSRELLDCEKAILGALKK